MTKYLVKGFYFSIPIFLCFLLIFIIDPYEMFNISRIIATGDKILVLNRSDQSTPRGSVLWKAIHFRRNPVKNLIIGDSQGKDINTKLIRELTGDEYFNFCIPGASYETMFNTFWFASKYADLNKVYFQVGFMNYNQHRSYDLFTKATDYLEMPHLYFISKDILSDAFCNVVYQISGSPEFMKDSYEFKDRESLDKLSKYRLELFFGKYSYPQAYLEELKRISAYCKDNSIELYFIIFPVYEKTDDYLREKGLLKMKQRFKEDIKSLSFVYDFDDPGFHRFHREDFLDYFHPRQHLTDEFTEIIWARPVEVEINE